MRHPWFYFHAGSVERGSQYEWRDAYARLATTGVQYPWSTKREAQSEAKRAGAKAIFYKTKEEAQFALNEAMLRKVK